MRTIKWGVLGTAEIAHSYTIPGMRMTDNCSLYAIAGRNLVKAEEFQREFGFQKAYGSYDELLADSEVEAVYIPLPNQLHYTWVMRALEAGKHVLCEKPMSPTLAQVKSMVAKAHEKGVLLMEAYAYLHTPYMAEIKSELQRGTIGEVLYIDSTYITSDYDVKNIRMRRETYGGSIYDLGCYNTSQILWLLEEMPKTVHAVSSFSAQNIDVFSTGVFTFENGKHASFQCGLVLVTDQDKSIERLEIHGTRGYIRADDAFNRCGKLRYTLNVDGEEQVKIVDTPHNYALEVEHMSRSIADGEALWVSNDFSCKNAALIEQLLETVGY